jgi:uroporphyrinogen-III synthase
MARLVVTRPPERAEELVAALVARGHEVAVCPLVALEPVGPDTVDVSGYDWVVVTSRTGGEELLRRRRGALPPVAAIGPGTAAALRTGGVQPALVASVSTQEGLLAELPRPAGRVLFAGAEGARRLLVEALDADFVALYRTVTLQPASFPPADLVLLASPSAAGAFAALALDLPAVSIGPQTTRAARERGAVVVAEAPTHDAAGLVAAVEEALSRLPSAGR